MVPAQPCKQMQMPRVIGRCRRSMQKGLECRWRRRQTLSNTILGKLDEIPLQLNGRGTSWLYTVDGWERIDLRSHFVVEERHIAPLIVNSGRVRELLDMKSAKFSDFLTPYPLVCFPI